MTNITAAKAECYESKKVLDILYRENLGSVLVGKSVYFDIIAKHGNTLLNRVPMRIMLDESNPHVYVSVDPFTNASGQTTARVTLGPEASGAVKILPYVSMDYLQENDYSYVRKNYGESIALCNYAVATKQKLPRNYKNRDAQGMIELIDKIEKDLERLRCLATGSRV
jgi:hypothetical protein